MHGRRAVDEQRPPVSYAQGGMMHFCNSLHCNARHLMQMTNDTTLLSQFALKGDRCSWPQCAVTRHRSCSKAKAWSERNIANQPFDKDPDTHQCRSFIHRCVDGCRTHGRTRKLRHGLLVSAHIPNSIRRNGRSGQFGRSASQIRIRHQGSGTEYAKRKNGHCPDQ